MVSFFCLLVNNHVFGFKSSENRNEYKNNTIIFLQERPKKPPAGKSQMVFYGRLRILLAPVLR
jgi:hypothetical protein